VLAKITYRDKVYEVEPGLTVKETLIKIGLEPQLYLAVRDGKLVTEDQKILPDDKIKLVAIVSGGSMHNSHFTMRKL
jgi:sulfur carrier protein ThiS